MAAQMLSVDTMTLFTIPSPHFHFPCPCIAYHSILLRSSLLRPILLRSILLLSTPTFPLPYLGLPWPTPILRYPLPSLFSSLLFSSLLFSSLHFFSLHHCLPLLSLTASAADFSLPHSRGCAFVLSQSLHTWAICSLWLVPVVTPPPVAVPLKNAVGTFCSQGTLNFFKLAAVKRSRGAATMI